MRWRIRRIVWQSDIASMLSGRYSGSSQGKPRIKVISVSGRNVVKIR